MWFAILGPVEVECGGEPVPISRPRHRALLAYMVLNAGQVISVDQIAQALWAGAPPSTAKSQLHAMISGLRRELASPPGTGACIDTVPGGYRCTVPIGQSDLAVFASRIANARAAMDREDWHTAAKWSRDALSLWRGPALGGVNAPYADAVRARLDDDRIRAQELLIEAELASGHHGAVASEIRALVDRYPTRERLVMQLMLALYRTDRRTEALRVARDFRRRLSEDQGLDPGEPFTDLERAILCADPGLTVAGLESRPPTIEGVEGKSVVVPRQLPSPPAIFVGRESLISELQSRIDAPGRPPVIAISGPGGTGKSALASLISHRVADRFPDGQLYVDLQGNRVGIPSLGPREVLGRFLRALGTPSSLVPEDVAEAAALYRSTISQRSVLVLLDNALDVSQIRPLLPAGDTCGVILTSRRRLSTLDAHHHTLGPLTEPESLQLLAECAGADRIAADQTSAEAIIGFCERVPLAIRIAAARLSGDGGLGLTDLCERLADESRRLDLLQLDDLAVRACFQSSFSTLTKPEREDATDAGQAFRRLGLIHVSHATAPIVAALLDTRVDEAETVTEQLSAAHLISHDGNRLRMHDLLRLFAIELADQFVLPEERASALQRVVTCYLGAVRRSSRLIRSGQRFDGMHELAEPSYADLLPITCAATGIAWLESERANLMGLARQMAEEPEPLCRFTLRLSAAMRAFLPLRGYLADWEELCVLSLMVAQRLADTKTQAAALMDLGAIAQRAGRLHDAHTHLSSALTIAETAGQIGTQAGILSYLGTYYAAVGERELAMTVCKRAIALRSRMGDDASTAITLTNAAMALTVVNLIAEAACYIDESIALKLAEHNGHGEGVARVVAAGIYLAQGRSDDAMRSVSIGLDLCREFGDRHNQWIALLVRATIHRHSGRTIDANRDAQLAAQLCRENGDPAGEAIAHRQMHRSDVIDRQPAVVHQARYPGLAWVIAVTSLPAPH